MPSAMPSTDPDSEALWAQTSERWTANMRRSIADLGANGELRTALTAS
ncbi:hypothetical protein [Pseudarthrobacter sp. N5]